MRCTRIVVALLTPALAASLAVLVLVGASGAATPTGGNLKPAKKGAGAVSWKGQVGSGSGQCFGGDGRPDASSGCDSYALTVALPAGYHATYLGKVVVSISNFGSSDVDLYVYDRNEDGTVGDFVDASATSKPTESVTLPAINHRYYVTAIPVDAVPSNQTYKGTAVLSAKAHLLSRTNAKAPPGFINYRASHDRF